MSGIRTTFDPAPLLEMARLKLAQDGFNDNTFDHLSTVTCDRRVAELCGIDRRTVFRWRTGEVRLDSRSADRAAINLGLHPCLIWDEWWDA